MFIKKFYKPREINYGGDTESLFLQFKKKRTGAA